MPVTYSAEEEIQGTLGALAPLRDFLGEAEVVLLVNGDTLCSWPWKKLITAHLRSQAAATLLLLSKPPDEALGGGVGVDGHGTIVQLRDSEAVGQPVRRHVFAGAHVLSADLLRRIEAGPGDIVSDLYIPLLREGRLLQGVVTHRRWHDLGTAGRYLEACLDWVKASKLDLRQRSVVSPDSQVARSSDLLRSVIEAGAVVEHGSKIESSVVLPEARVAAGSSVRDCILGPAVTLPPATTIERRLVTRIRSGYQPNTRDSVMGELIYSPLE